VTGLRNRSRWAAKIWELTAEIDRLKPLTEAATAAVAADENGLKVREEALVKQMNEISQAIAGVNDEIIEKTGDAQQIRAEGGCQKSIA
jgi:hypothetical protein